ncbi:hypothetical protein ACFLZ1_05285 [Patescibacteria group bacterium]
MVSNTIKDRSSSLSYNFIDKAITLYWKLKDKRIILKRNVIIKSKVEFRLSDNARLIIGENSIVQNYAFFHLTKPSPLLEIGKGVVIGRFNIIAVKKYLKIGDYTRIGSFVQIIDHGHNFVKGEYIKNQKAKIKPIYIGSDVWIGFKRCKNW